MSAKKTAVALVVAAITSIGLATPAQPGGTVSPMCLSCWAERAV